MSSTDQDNRIRHMWLDPDFPGGWKFMILEIKKANWCFLGSFSGIATFQQNLAAIGIHVTQKKLKNILSYIPEYVQSAQQKKKFIRRKYWNHGYDRNIVLKSTNYVKSIF